MYRGLTKEQFVTTLICKYKIDNFEKMIDEAFREGWRRGEEYGRDMGEMSTYSDKPLSHCPNCGMEAYLVSQIALDGEDNWYVQCKNCDCHTKFCPLKWVAQKAWEEGNVWYSSTSKK